MGSRRSGGATGRRRRSAWAVEGRVVPLDEGGRPQVFGFWS
jgi:hypothetical protein